MSCTGGLLIDEKLLEILCLKTVFEINIASLNCQLPWSVANFDAFPSKLNVFVWV